MSQTNKTLTVNRDTLLASLTLLKGCVVKRNTNPILSHVLVEAMGDRRLRLTSSNLDISVTTSLAADFGDSFRTTMPADKLHDIIRLLPKDSEIRMSILESTVSITYGKGRYRLQCLSADDFPNVEKLVDPVTWTVPESTMARILGNVASAMGSNDVRYYLNGALLEIKDNLIRAVSTDGHRLYTSDTDAPAVLGNSQQIIPRQAVMLLTHILGGSDDMVTVSMADSFIEFRRGDTTIRSRLIDGRYPDYNKVIPKNSPVRVEIDRELFCEVLRRVAIVADENNRAVRLSFAKNAVNVSAKNSSSESSEECVGLDYMEEPFELAVNSSYLLDALETLPDSTVELAMRDGISPVVITGKGNKSPLFVVMPCRA